MVEATGREGSFPWREAPGGDSRTVRGRCARKEWAKGRCRDEVRKVVRERRPQAKRGLNPESDGKPGEGFKQRGNMTA